MSLIDDRADDRADAIAVGAPHLLSIADLGADPIPKQFLDAVEGIVERKARDVHPMAPRSRILVRIRLR